MKVAFIINLSLSWLYTILHDNLARFLEFTLFIEINFFGKSHSLSSVFLNVIE